jgi:hypothetical protein
MPNEKLPNVKNAKCKKCRMKKCQMKNAERYFAEFIKSEVRNDEPFSLVNELFQSILVHIFY